MKRLKYALILAIVLCFASCGEEQGDAVVSGGNINEISIVISDALWNGEVGDGLRRKLAAPVDGLTQEEPLFTLNQMHDLSYDTNTKKRRNIIVIEKYGNNDFKVTHNNYCKKQNVFTISGKSIDDLLHLIDMHSDEIIRIIKQTEIAENQARNLESGLLDTLKFREQFHIDIRIPATYTFAMDKKDFAWLKRDISGGNANILLYRVPYTTVERNKTMDLNIITMRDSIGKQYIHGKEPETFMVTEESYAPYFFMTSFNDKRAFETRGNWEMANDYMSGPFLNYVIRDDKHNSYLIVEGFIYSPSSPKRDLVIELESIIKSLRLL